MRARGRRLLFVCIDTGTQGVHEIDYLRRWTLFGWFDLFSGFFLLEQIDQRVLIAVVELSRIEASSEVMTLSTVVAGIAKPMPTLPPDGE